MKYFVLEFRLTRKITGFRFIRQANRTMTFFALHLSIEFVQKGLARTQIKF